MLLCTAELLKLLKSKMQSPLFLQIQKYILIQCQVAACIGAGRRASSPVRRGRAGGGCSLCGGSGAVSPVRSGRPGRLGLNSHHRPVALQGSNLWDGLRQVCPVGCDGLTLSTQSSEVMVEQ